MTMKKFLKNYTLPKGHVLALKILYPNRQSARNDFQYPGVGGIVEAPDWNPFPICGNGLHGYLWGRGDVSVSLFRDAQECLFQVHEVNKKEMVNLIEKIKYKKAKVVFETIDPFEATLIFKKFGPKNYKPIFDIKKIKSDLLQPFLHHNMIFIEDGKKTTVGRCSQIYGKNNVIQNASWGSLLIAGNFAKQSATTESILIAGDNAHQNVTSECKCIAGKNSVINCQSGSIVKAGLGSIINFTHAANKVYTKTIKIDGELYMPDTWYKFSGGKVRELKKTPAIDLKEIMARKKFVKELESYGRL